MIATNCDFMFEAMSTPGKFEAFLADPENLENILHFTEHDERDLYDEVNPEKNPELSQVGKVVVITGAGRGIGRGAAIMFARAKTRAIAICARTLSELEDTRSIISELNPDTSVYLQQVDVTSEEDVREFFVNVEVEFGQIDVVISNAGVNSSIGPITTSSTAQWWANIEVNLKGTYLVSKYFAKSLDGRTGTLVNISSLNAIAAIPASSAYCCSKLASHRMLEILHLEAPNVRCFSMHPGAVDTEMMQSASKQMGIELKWRWTEAVLPGAVALWLTTARAEFLRGRWLSTNWRVEELEARKEDVLERNLLKTAFNARLGIT